MSYTAIRPQRVPVYPGDPATHFPPSKAVGQDKDPGPSRRRFRVDYRGCNRFWVLLFYSFYCPFVLRICQGTSQNSFRAAASRALSRRVR